jgi:ABC-type branched-subunit amino acid transport system substrate-binding protein
VLEGYFSEVNKNGGVFGRQIELLAVPTGQSPEASLDKLRDAFAAEGVLALVGAYTIGLDESLLTFLRSDNVPLVAPFTLDPGDAFIDATAFYLFAGLDEQARVLADRSVADGASTDKVLVVGPQGSRADNIVNAAKDQLRKKDRDNPPTVASYAPGSFEAADIAETVAEGGFEALIFLGGQAELDALVAELVNRAPVPRVYLLSSLLSRPLMTLPAVFDQRVFLAYPTLSSDISAKGRQEYQELVKIYSWGNDHVQARLAALAAAKLFVEGLLAQGGA